MSVKVTCKTKLNDQITLLDALKEIMGANNVKVEGNNIVVTSQWARAVFTKGADGNFQIDYDNMHEHRFRDLLPETKNGIVHNKLAQIYSKIKVMSAMKSIKGGRLVKNEVDQDGRIRLRIKTSSYE